MAIRTLLVDVGPMVATISRLGATFLHSVMPGKQATRRPRRNVWHLLRGDAKAIWNRLAQRGGHAGPAVSPYRGVDPARVAVLERLAGLGATPRHAGIGRVVHRLATLADLDIVAADHLQAIVPLYDIGNVAVPDHMLQKHGPLDAAELDVMRQHAAVGARVLSGDDNTPLLDLAAEVALCHHERWDGSGYPRGLVGDQIPLGARIVAVVDVFDAMLTPRPGEAALPLEAVIELLRQGAGVLFDPRLTSLFLDNLPVMLALRDRPLDGLPAVIGDTASPYMTGATIRLGSPLPDGLGAV